MSQAATFFRRTFVWVCLVGTFFSLSLSVTPTSAQATGSLTIDYSSVQVNQQKQNLFNARLNNIFSTLKSKIPELGHSDITKVKMLYPADMAKQVPSGSPSLTAYGAYFPDSHKLLINSEAFERTTEANEVMAHEILHSFVPAGNGYDLASSREKGDAFEEMLVEYFAEKYYPNGIDAYDWLEESVPAIKKILVTAKQPDPDKVLAKAMFSSKLTDLNKIIDPYITTKDFLAGLGQYLDTTPEKTNKAGAQTYLAAVLSKVQAATGIDGDEETTPTLSFLPSALTIGADYTAKTPIGTILSVDPGASGATFALSVPTGSKISLGKTSITFKSGTDYNDDDTGNANHAFGVTLATGATAGETITATATGTVNGKSVTQTLIITIGANGSGASTAGSTTLKPVDQIDPSKLPGSDLKIGEILPKIVRGFLTLIAISAFFGLLYSGLMYITAGGDAAKTVLARKNIVWSLTGVIIAIFSYSLVNLAANWNGLGFGLTNTNSGGGGSGNGSGGGTGGEIASNDVAVTDSAGSDIGRYVITDPTNSFSTRIGVRLKNKPTSDVTVTLNTGGDVKLSLPFSSLNFTTKNWDQTQFTSLSYLGGGKNGQTGQVNFVISGQTVGSLPIEITASGDGGGGSGGGGDTTALPIFITDHNGSELTDYKITRPTVTLSEDLGLALESEPAGGKVDITISSSGDFPLTVVPASLTYTSDDWSLSQAFTFAYGGDGHSGQSAKLDFSVNGKVVHSFKFTIP